MPYSHKTDYTQSINKRAVQASIYEKLKWKKLTKVVGLGGPNITDYLLLLRSYKVKSAEIYEYDISKLTLQLDHYMPIIDSEIKYSDVYHAAANQPNTFYDLDFCCSINNARIHIPKFTKNVCFTLSIRPIGLDKTIKEFAKLVDNTLHPELKLVYSHYDKYSKYKSYVLKTVTKEYQCYIYKDTVPMISITDQTNF